MISDPSSYRIADFIPFSREVYEALITYYNEAIWPMQSVFLLASLALLALTALRPNASFLFPGIFLAIAWWWSGLVFIRQYLVEILPQAEPVITIFLIQGLACLSLVFGLGNLRIQSTKTIRFWVGWAIFAFAACCPYSLLFGQALSQTMLFGWAPAATAAGTIGILVMTKGPLSRWSLLLFPVIYLISTALLWIGLIQNETS